MSEPRCLSCGRPILWAVVEASGRRMPVDVEPVAGGNVFLSRIVDEIGESRDGVVHVRVARDVLLATIIPAGEDVADRDRYVSHFATCPYAAQHRRPR